ncbi:T9SS type B sorting domain-containing protein [Flavobacterium algicola]|uniref:T9SS type B sorting domain-containing protein n=1 Tax=Flavobacterium algicola TaxID=556529 RepID=UPI001EFD6765|nr:T9SS type B sorting domain-containing protein [Flavobacterium algicola]MCG9792099.1 T9SS type B sorting domain-containing protein [Flavobacterium algicola]
MKKLYIIFCLLFSFGILAQSITVDDNSRTANQLVQLLLGNSCTTVSNISISSNQSTAYFNNNSSSFPIKEGVIIRNGVAKYSEGKYTGNNLSSQITSNTDADLQKISNSAGQNIPITDVAYLEFEFIPLSNKFSFDFLFASNEYGEFQCGFSDVFAFLLTDLDSNTTTNLAILPGTNDPVSVKNIRDSKFNSSCTSVNSTLFSTYNVTDPSLSAMNMRGFTQILNASATVLPNRSYRIRLVIGDANDSNYDSAVFLSSGSFTTSIDLGPDQTICDGNTFEINTGLTDSKYIHTWKKNNITISGQNQQSLIIKEPGTYQVVIEQIGTSCLITDEINILDLKINTPADLRNCRAGSSAYIYDLTANNVQTLGLDQSKYELSYFTNLDDAKLNTNPVLTPNNYSASDEQTIFIKIKNKIVNEYCNSIESFELILDNTALPQKPSNIELCDISGGNIVDLAQTKTTIFNGQDTNLYSISYHLSEADASANKNPLPTSYSVPQNPKTTTIWARMSTILNRSCYNLTSFEIVVNPKPLVDVLSNVIECSEYVLPNLVSGDYYTQSNGRGTLLHAGDIIDKSGTYYIFSGPDDKSCTNESNFNVDLIKEYTIPLDYCGVFNVPSPFVGTFYTSAGGPTGTGTQIPAGTQIRSSQTIYYYGVLNNTLCKDEAYDINIIPLPLVDAPKDVVTCNTYELTPLTYGDYYTGAYGTGTKLMAGSQITSTKTLYIFATDGNCVNQNSFTITIIPSVVDVPACGSYILPKLSTGNYFTEAAGAGTVIPFGTKITSSTTIYIYANTTIAPNCTNDLFFKINIKPIPVVDQLNDVLQCVNDPYVLPTITNGEYYTGTNRTGKKLIAGDKITSSQKLYINNLVNGCTNESSFNVEIRALPLLSIITDVTSCKAYTIPKVSNGVFYTESGGKGREIKSGESIEQTQTIYLYNKWSDLNTCSIENAISINIIGITVDKLDDVIHCDSYTLPALTVGNYFTQSGGKGALLSAGTVITASQKLYIYGKKGTRFICEDENPFMVTISKTPLLNQPASVEACDYYTLPVLTEGNYYSGSKGQGTAYFAGDIIKKSQIIYIYATAFNNNNCFDEKSFQITIYPLLNLVLRGGVICVDYNSNEVLNPYYIDTKLDPIKFTVDWYLKGELVGTGHDFTAVEEGIYDVFITKNTVDSGSDCGYNPTSFIVKKSSPAISTVSVSDSFSDDIDISATAVSGYGDYEYKLDDGVYQDSPVFTNVISGQHIIHINDKNGSCNVTTVTATVLKHPKFFTPNNDGYNDYWNIPDLADQPNATISIFDRYGKLITQFKTASLGWDGRYNSSILPADDYWFVVDYKIDDIEKTFKSHFSLKR